MWTNESGGEVGGKSFPGSIVSEIASSELGYARGPERVLLTAVLFDGIQAYMNYALADTVSEKDRYLEAYRWVHRSSEDYVFSFDNVCEGLGVDPEYLRLGLANAAQSQSFEWKRSRRNF